MIDRGKHNVLGVMVDAVDYEAATLRVIDAAERQRPFAATALAVHGVMTGVDDDDHRFRLNSLDLVTPDGQPVRWALDLLHGTSLPDRVCGPALMLNICALAAERRLPVFLYGSTEETLAALARNLTERLPDLVLAGVEPSKFRQVTLAEQATIAERIRSCGTRIAFIGLGCPRQEVFVYELRRLLEMPLVAVGAAFDFHAGTLRQAPPALGRLGLEWLFRLSMEPRRLWRRYAYLNPRYLALLAAQHRGWWNPSLDARPTPAQLGYA